MLAADAYKAIRDNTVTVESEAQMLWHQRWRLY